MRSLVSLLMKVWWHARNVVYIRLQPQEKVSGLGRQPVACILTKTSFRNTLFSSLVSRFRFDMLEGMLAQRVGCEH